MIQLPSPDCLYIFVDKGFAKLSKYEEHAIKHSSVKSHTCIECGVKFKQETGLRTHVQFEHGTDEAK